MQLTTNFHLLEFACKCRSRGFYQREPLSYCGGLAVVHPELVERLQVLRDRIGKPVTITSGYRCPAYNRRPQASGGVGGADQSWHMRGYAADMIVGGMMPREVAALAEEVGFNGIGVYSNFVHVDVRYGPRWRG